MEQFNFLNTTTSVETMTTFAASTTTPSYSSTSQLSFNQHLQQSFDSKEMSVDSESATLNSADIDSLADDIVAQMKKNASDAKIDKSNQHEQSIDDLLSELNLSEKDAQALTSTLESITALNKSDVSGQTSQILDQLKKAINSTQPLALRDELSGAIDDIEQLFDSELVSSKSSEYTKDDANAEQVLNEDILYNIEEKLSDISTRLQDSTLNQHEKNMLSDAKAQLEAVKNAFNNSTVQMDEVSSVTQSMSNPLNNEEQLNRTKNELLAMQALKPVEISSVTQLITNTLNSEAVSKPISVLDTRLNEEQLNKTKNELPTTQSLKGTEVSGDDSDNEIKAKIIDIIEKLPVVQQIQLKQELERTSQTNTVVNPKNTMNTSPDQFLASIEDSHNTLSDVTLSNSAKLSDNEVVSGEYGKKLNHELVKQSSSEFNEVLPKGDKIESILSQLESSFKASQEGRNNDIDVAQINAKIEQQVLKDVNGLNQNTIKTSEALAPKILLHENVAAAQQLKEHLTMMARGGLGQAVLHLDPEELGAMSVRIVMQNDQMNVSFQVQNPQAKELLEQAMNKLRESLEAQGIELNHSDVEQQSEGDSQSNSSNENKTNMTNNTFDESNVEPITLVLSKQSSNGIDYYA